MEAPVTRHIVADCQDPKIRVDQYLVGLLKALSRSQIQHQIKKGHILLNGQTCTPKTTPKAGDLITWPSDLDTPTSSEHTDSALTPENIPLDLLHQDADLLALNKAPGMVVHPAAGNETGTLVHALLGLDTPLSQLAGPTRHGIVHRLDKDTSGTLVIAKNDATHSALTELFSQRLTRKLYLTVLAGPLAPSLGSEGFIRSHLGRHPKERKKIAEIPPPQKGTEQGSGKEALTAWAHLPCPESPLHQRHPLILCRIFTGRTHQIRVHLKAHLHQSLLGDPIYGNKKAPKADHLHLHSWQLGFEHPSSGKPMHFISPPPEHFEPWLKALDPQLLQEQAQKLMEMEQ